MEARRWRWPRVLTWSTLLLAALLLGTELLARVGGGGGFGGGGSGGGGGGGGGDADLIFFLIWLCFKHPVIGIPLTVVVIIGWIVFKRRERRGALPASVENAQRDLVTGTAARRRRGVQTQLGPLLADDPNFSEILFLDFAQLLYTRYQEGLGERDLTGLSPYLSESLFAHIEAGRRGRGRGALEVEEVIVGAIQIERVELTGEEWQIICQVEANYTEVTERGSKREAYYSKGRLFFRRHRGVLSKGPDEILALGCPSCGSPVQSDQRGSCAHCGQPQRSGLFHWMLQNAVEQQRMPRIRTPLSSGGAEVGTDFPTLRDPVLSAAVRSFHMRYPGETLDRLRARARTVFLTLQRAWTSSRWEQARAFETDRLFQMHRFWMDRYRERGWRNVLEKVEVGEIDLVKLTRDAFYESATLRIYASMTDYTVDRNDKVVDGDRGKVRRFSEYWTFVRRAGFTPSAETDEAHCPSCGAETKVAMDGRCAYCDAHLSSARFDWTLAKIEQDEAYAG